MGVEQTLMTSSHASCSTGGALRPTLGEELDSGALRVGDEGSEEGTSEVDSLIFDSRHGWGTPRINELRLDPMTGRWVAVSGNRAERPSAFRRVHEPAEMNTGRPCPFCPENLDDLPPALETYGANGEWLVRVVPNLYPVFQGNQPFVVNHVGPIFTQATAGGMHEVLIISPRHDQSWGMLSDEQAGLVMSAVRDRFEEHEGASCIRYTQLIVNAGRAAGASLEHPHGQLLALSFVPREIIEEQAGFSRFAGGCLLCATIRAEQDAGHRIVFADDDIVVLCPFWSSTPYEMLVLPRRHQPHFHRQSPSTVVASGIKIRDALARLDKIVGPVAYNLILHSAPYRSHGEFHWHMHVVPKLTTQAGFEMGTGIPINIVAPEIATQDLRAGVPVPNRQPA